MNNNTIQLIHQLTNKCTSFIEAVLTLQNVGINRYHCDLIGQNKTYYDDTNAYYIHKGSFHLKHEPLTADFNQVGVKAVLTAAQQGQIDYLTFLQQIWKQGAVCYTVFIAGRQVHYVGRKGETLIEKIPL